VGGPGSGNWVRWGPAKRRVEQCDDLDTAFLRRNGWLRPGAVLTGPVRWTYSPGGTVSQLTLTTDLSDPAAPAAHLSYTLGGEAIAYPVRLVTTRPHYGGARWWFLCPLRRGTMPCGRRVRKLYRASRYFGCRGCHDLTYRSRQEHDARVSQLMRNPEAIRHLLRAGDGRAMLLAAKAALNLAVPDGRRGRAPRGSPRTPAANA
jgi:hypothetical protein